MRQFLFVLLLAVGSAAYGAKPETLVEGGYDQAEMSAAIERARKEVDTFIAIMKSAGATNFAVKVPIEDKGEVEHFWMTNVTYRDGRFTGKINNEPGIVTNVKLGQSVTVEKNKISDWLYMRDGKMHGNYTLHPLLATMSEEEAAYYRSMMANPDG